MKLGLGRSGDRDPAPATGEPATEEPATGEPATEDTETEPAASAASGRSPAQPGVSDAPGTATRYADSGLYPDSGAAGAADVCEAPDDAGFGASAGPAAADAPATAGASVPRDATGTPIAHGATAAPAVPAAPAGDEATPSSRPGAADARPPAGGEPGESAGGPDGPLLGNVPELRASWQRIQAGFVDDPKEAVADAADLVEHTAQALVGALQQRQRELRARWDRGRSPGGPASSAGAAPADAVRAGQPAAGDAPDTEELRQLMQRYRALFNQICHP